MHKVLFAAGLLLCSLCSLSLRSLTATTTARPVIAVDKRETHSSLGPVVSTWWTEWASGTEAELPSCTDATGSLHGIFSTGRRRWLLATSCIEL